MPPRRRLTLRIKPHVGIGRVAHQDAVAVEPQAAALLRAGKDLDFNRHEGVPYQAGHAIIDGYGLWNRLRQAGLRQEERE